ncbi:hypothetical protein QUB56_35385, partial [Microcoleus sp. AR_TQ3_B6]|uniref:hypothetical protein n=1 Tax=Microcoleus sp. AR_TQ3_B6 TaxID=3055284 RepID=UPI002FCFDC37
VNVSVSKDGGVGVSVSLQIPFTPIEIELGLGFPQKKPNPNSTPTPTPTPTSTPTPTIAAECESSGKLLYGTLKRTIEGGWKGLNLDGTIKKLYQYEYTYAPLPNGKFLRTFTYTNFGATTQQPPGSVEVTLNLWPARSDDSRFAQEIAEPIFPGVVYNGTVVSEYFETFGGAEYQVICLPNPNSPPTPSPPPPPSASPFPNPPPRRRNMDECCRESTKLLREIHKGLGIAKFPGKLPATIIQEVPKEGEQPAEPPQVPIEDFVDLLDWQFRRDDERWGQWEIQIDIKDADLTKEGNQEKSVKFPNLAESVAEIEGQILSIQANVEALVALSVRNLTESGMARQEAIKGYLATMAIAKYMAFPYAEFDVEIPSTYTPGATSIDKLIVETVVHTKGIEYENKETLRDLILDLLQAAAIIRAVHWRQVNPKNDIKKQILSQLKGSVDLSEKITNVKTADGDTAPTKESWEDKLDQYENGFGFSTGIENANTPYGRDREQRPRIRQIGDNIAQAGKDE